MPAALPPAPQARRRHLPDSRLFQPDFLEKPAQAVSRTRRCGRGGVHVRVAALQEPVLGQSVRALQRLRHPERHRLRWARAARGSGSHLAPPCPPPSQRTQAPATPRPSSARWRASSPPPPRAARARARQAPQPRRPRAPCWPPRAQNSQGRASPADQHARATVRARAARPPFPPRSRLPRRQPPLPRRARARAPGRACAPPRRVPRRWRWRVGVRPRPWARPLFAASSLRAAPAWARARRRRSRQGAPAAACW
mmetsp:Transcript_34761/g.86724  ORF Transcript_34761/g.86724 Transcript_34761/m.86724 type:complete len:254 (-) Transcript_34761:502-1263(-)